MGTHPIFESDFDCLTGCKNDAFLSCSKINRWSSWCRYTRFDESTGASVQPKTVTTLAKSGTGWSKCINGPLQHVGSCRLLLDLGIVPSNHSPCHWPYSLWVDTLVVSTRVQNSLRHQRPSSVAFQPPLSVVWLFQHSVLVLLHLPESCPTRLKKNRKLPYN